MAIWYLDEKELYLYHDFYRHINCYTFFKLTTMKPAPQKTFLQKFLTAISFAGVPLITDPSSARRRTPEEPDNKPAPVKSTQFIRSAKKDNSTGQLQS
jgi:hypothetical protein